VRVWENVEAGVLAGVGQKVTVLESIEVDQSGAIFVPYAGRLQAAGETPDGLRRAITAALSDQTPDPQVEVARVAGDGATVNVLGAVRAQGVYPIEAPTRRLSAMLARAGGVAIDPEVALVKLQRGGRSGQIWLPDLYADPRFDVALRPGDRIIVEQDRRSFTALGASSRQARIGFTKRDMSVLEALGAAGGLDGRVANPTGVFVFRVEPQEVAVRVTGQRSLIGPQRMAYVFDLTSAPGMFAARDFFIRDADTLYVTEAPFAAWTRILGGVTSTVNFAASADQLVN
jgi:polysaccharide export outer membrane protein